MNLNKNQRNIKKQQTLERADLLAQGSNQHTEALCPNHHSTQSNPIHIQSSQQPKASCIILKMFVSLLLLSTISTSALGEWSVTNSIKHLNEIIDNADSVEIVFPTPGDDNPRHKRDTNSNQQSLLIKDWILDVVPNEDLFLEKGSFETEWVSDDGVLKVAVGEDECTMERGQVRGDDESLVAVTICEGGVVTGLIQIGGDLYFIEPLSGVGINTHLLYKAKRMQIRLKEDVEFFKEDFEPGRNVSEGKVVRNKRESYLRHLGSGVGDHPEWINKIIDESDEKKSSEKNRTVGVEEKRERRPKYEDDDEVGYFLDTVWEKDPIISRPSAQSHSPQRWLEIAIAVDHSVIAFHGKERAQQYVLAIMNIVSAIYKDPSLASNLKLVIVRMLFYEDKKQGEVRVGNSKRSLENVNRWNDRTSRALPAGSARHDVAVWLTRLDLGGPSGYAPVSGACDSARSCTLNRDEGLTSSFIIAHELAHVLGLSHDGDPDAGNACAAEATLGSVMAPMVSATFHRFTWSTCSRTEFHSKTSAWHCLNNAPSKSANATHLKSTLQQTFTMDEQCRMEFGEGFSLCRSFDLPEPCSHLWCGHKATPLVCKTKKGPPLEGTECGFDRWCLNGFCESLDRRSFGFDPVLHNPSDGGWSEWAAWAACSRPCGGGVSFRVRRCDNPRPAYGGDNCVGRSEEFRVCNYRDCAEPLRDFRAQQCARLPTIGPLLGSLRHRANQTWLPHEADQRSLKCQLTCVSREVGDVFLTGENLVDGTPCSYDQDNDICIQGECQSLGCDGVLDSTLGRDSCGVCGGNNSQCHTVTQSFDKTLRRSVTRMAVLPRLARDVRIVADAMVASRRPDLSPVKMSLRDRRRCTYNLTSPEDRFAPTQLVRDARATLVVEGARFHYERRGSNEVLWARGPLLAELVVSVTVDDFETTTSSGPASVVASVSYVVHTDHPRGRHVWQSGGWGPCSKSCGGGKRARTIACRDTQTNRIVAKRNCPLVSKPGGQYENCNEFGCEIRWQTATWEHCSATCGPAGVQHRQVFCMANDTAVDKYFVDPALCESADKPAETRACNRMPCPAQWLSGNWSECSSSCGRGFETRSHHCPGTPLECGVAPTPERRHCKGRRDAGLCATPIDKGCKRDASKYCRLTELLGRYCVVPGYRQLCCVTCRKAFNELPVQITF